MSRSGSHAGRGFRYQHAVSAWLAVQVWGGKRSPEIVVPEGADDVELRGRNGRILVQVKSRRGHLGDFSVADVAGFIRALWSRAARDKDRVARLLLVLERGLAGGKIVNGVLGTEVRSVLRNHAGFATFSDITEIAIVANPREDGIATISSTLACTPMIAEVAFGDVLTRIGAIADENGVLSKESYRGVSSTETQRAFDRILANTSPGLLQDAISKGLCEAVDFTTALEDPSFYMGVDVQPGHLAAGLIVERPDSTGRAISALERARNLLIAGPSGSGKSALMWEIAAATRHTIRWFRIKSAATDIAALIRLADSMRATRDAPMGFVVDDVGRVLSEVWNALARETSERPGLVLMGSVREEDLLPLPERHRAYELREEPDERLAKRIWAELQQRGATSASGWREAWRQSQGLVLEFAHILTQGARLRDVIQTQIEGRARDPARLIEIKVLRVVSAAGMAGVAVDTALLSKVLGVEDEVISFAMRRLLDEHLVRRIGSSRVGSLHQLRAAAIFDSCHAFPPPSPEKSICDAVACLAEDEVGAFVARCLEAGLISRERVISALAARLNERPDILFAADALRGLGQAQIAQSVKDWLSSEAARAISPTHLQLATMFGLPGIEFPKIDMLERLRTASDALRSLVTAASQDDPRRALVGHLLEETVTSLVGKVDDLSSLEIFLRALVGSVLEPNLLVTLRLLRPPLLVAPLSDVKALLQTIRVVDGLAAREWVAAVGQDALLARIHAGTPWSTPAALVQEQEGLTAYCNIRFVSSTSQQDPHSDVVAMCHLLLALAPDAEIAVCSAMGPNEKILGIGALKIADKRIRRRDLPPPAVPEWNRRWMLAVGDAVAPATYTQYLSQSSELLERLLPALEEFLNAWFGSRQVGPSCAAAFDDVERRCVEMTPPTSAAQAAFAESNGENRFSTPIQDVLQGFSGILTDLAKLPEEASRCLLVLDDLRKHVEKAELEPWHLLEGGKPSALDRMKSLANDLFLIAGESGFIGAKPGAIWRKPKASRRTAFTLAMLDVKNAFQRRIEAFRQEVLRELRDTGLTIEVLVRRDLKQVSPWPPTEVMLIVDSTDPIAWLTSLAENSSRFRAAVGTYRRFYAVPRIRGLCACQLAMGGREVLLPEADTARDWLQESRHALLDDSIVRTFRALAEALTEISGIQKYGYGSEGRPAVEREALVRAEATAETALGRLRHEIGSVPSQIEDLVNAARSGGSTLAGDALNAVDGLLAGEAASMTAILLGLIQFDLDRARDVDAVKLAAEGLRGA